MAQSLSREKQKECREVFDLFDKDRDNAINTSELGLVMRALGGNPTQSDLVDIIKQYDLNKNGKIEYDEFVNLFAENRRQPDSEDELLRAFQVFDQDGNGYLDARELRTVVTTLGEPLSEEEAEQLIRDADANKDGRINYYEFVKVMLSEF